VLEQREIMETALEAIIALLAGEEPVTRKTKWFELRDARLQLRPYGDLADVRVAAMVSPSGPRAAGRFGIGMLSVAATTPAGFDALKGAWDIAEDRAREFGTAVDRSRWAVVAPVHLAESVEQARKDVHYGMTEWLDYFKRLVPLPIGAQAEDIPGAIDELTEQTGLAVIGTPDMAIKQIERLIDQTGGLGTFLIQAHDWADPEATRKSFDLFSRYVMPHFQGQLQSRVDNQTWVMSSADEFKRQFSAAQDKARRQHEEAVVETTIG
jgi:limonene 1,2-monooxygenase